MNYSEITAEWHDNPIEDISDIDLRLHNFRILFAYHSGRIENDKIEYHDTSDIFKNGKISNYTGDIRTLFEQQNQKDCYEYLKPNILEKMPLSNELIRKIHFELTKGTYDESRFAKGERPGEFKIHDFVVGYLGIGSESADVGKNLEELFAEANNYSGDKIIETGAYLHAGFENIHPFADGNGRVGRTLMNYYLMINNHPPIVIFDEDKNYYYKALEAFDLEEDLQLLVCFLKNQIEKTWS